MPVARGRKKIDEKLNQEEQKQLLIALAEMRARGLSIPDYLRKKENNDWHIGANGYATSIDGRMYNPNSSQKRFIDSTARFAAFIGSRGSGKSAAGAQKSVRKIMAGESGAVLNPDFENFKYSTWPEFRNWIPWDMVIPSQKYRSSPEWEPHKPFTMVFKNGVRVYCKGLKDPDSARGPNINWLWYDEGTRDITGMGWKLAVASVRVGDKPQAWTTATPRGRDHWTYKFFELKEISPEAIEAFKGENRPIAEIFYGTINDNKVNLDPGFYASLLAAYPSGWLRAQEIDGQFVDEGGVLGNPNWFAGKVLPTRPSIVTKRVRYWDLAASEKKMKGDDPDETVGTLMSFDGTYKYIEDQICFWGDWEKIVDVIVATAEYEGIHIPIYIEQEPGSGGKNQVAAIASLPRLRQFTVKAHNPAHSGDKVMRANIWFGEAAKGEIFMVQGDWNDGFLKQLSSFPTGNHDDRIDSVSGARLIVAPIKKWRQIPFRAV